MSENIINNEIFKKDYWGIIVLKEINKDIMNKRLYLPMIEAFDNLNKAMENVLPYCPDENTASIYRQLIKAQTNTIKAIKDCMPDVNQEELLNFNMDEILRAEGVREKGVFWCHYHNRNEEYYLDKNRRKPIFCDQYWVDKKKEYMEKKGK